MKALKKIAGISFLAAMVLASVMLVIFGNVNAILTWTSVTLLLLAGFAACYEGSAFITAYHAVIYWPAVVIATVLAVALAIVNKSWIALVIALVAIVASIVMFVRENAILFWIATITAIIAILALNLNVMNVQAEEKQSIEAVSDKAVSEVPEEETVSLEEYKELVARLEEYAQENGRLEAELADALQEIENLKAKCGECPICNGEMTLEELQNSKKGTKNNSTTGKKNTTSSTKKTSNGIPYTGKPLGDGMGNGVPASVTPIYDPNVKVGADGKIHIDQPAKDVNFGNTDGGSNGNVVVVINDGEKDKNKEEEQPITEEETREEVTISAKVEGTLLTATAPEGYVATDDLYSYIIASDGVTITSAVAENNIVKIEFSSEKSGEIELCKGMFKKGTNNVNAALTVEVEKTKVEESENNEEEKKEMTVTAITAEAICDNGYEGENLQYKVVAEGSNLDYGKIEVSIGSISADGIWSFAAPSTSGTATVSFGSVSATVNYTVNQKEMIVTTINVETICDTGYEGDSLQYKVVAEGTEIDYSKMNVSAGTISADGTWSFAAPAESGTATVSFGSVSATINYTVNKLETQDNTDEIQEDNGEEDGSEEQENGGEETEEPEIVLGTLTGIEMWENEVVCGSDIQGEIHFDGNIDWSQVSVSVDGLSCELSGDGTITIHTTDVAASYTVVASFNGSEVSATFSVAGVENADIVW